jgi:hypothetical protein
LNFSSSVIAPRDRAVVAPKHQEQRRLSGKQLLSTHGSRSSGRDAVPIVLAAGFAGAEAPAFDGAGSSRCDLWHGADYRVIWCGQSSQVALESPPARRPFQLHGGSSYGGSSIGGP